MKVADPPKDDRLIVPGWRVGKVYLGMTSSALLAAMGEPSSTRPSDYSTGLEWENAGLYVWFNKKADLVDTIDVRHETYKTAEDVHLGSSELAATVKLGKPEASDSGSVDAFCYKRGITLFLSTNRHTKYGWVKVPYQVVSIRVVPSKEWELNCK